MPNARVLIIDDNADHANVLRDLLTLEGYQSYSSTDPRAGLDLAAKIKPNVVILDLAMPEIDGFEVCRRLKAEAWAEGTTVIALTARTDMEERAIAAGIAHYMQKTTSIHTLTSLLDRVLLTCDA